MAFEEILRTISMEAAGDLTAQQYRFCRADATNGDRVAVVSGADAAETIGVLQDNEAFQAGIAASLATDGVTKVVAGGTVAAGDPVTNDAAGAAVDGAAATNVHGVARTGGAANDIISVLLQVT